MPESHIPDPVAQLTDPVVSSPDELPADPLLGSDSFIDPDRVEPEAASPEPQEQEQEQVQNVGFDPTVAIAAQPISMLRPVEDPVSVEKTPRRKNMEEMSVKPSWLPDDWTMSLRVRASGNSAGFIDRYYTDPTGQRMFRSKNEVLHFIETGSKRKRRSTSGTAAAQSPAKQNRSRKRSKKSSAMDSDVARPPNTSNGDNADSSG